MSGDYDVGSYGIFSNAVSTTKNTSTSISTSNQSLESLKTQLNNESIFMGPVCDSCVEGFGKAGIKITDLITNLSTIESYFIETSSTYQAGDDAAKKVLQFSGGKISVGASSSSGVQTGNANQDAIYNYLSQQGFNDAAICGILANIQHESGFNPNALGDGGTSYGICQWHNSRWDRLKSYCSQNGLDSTTIDGQLSYLVWELQNNYPSVYETIKNVPNTEQGAYDAAYEWTVHFEIPANKEQSGQNRGNTAISNYWPTYSASSV